MQKRWIVKDAADQSQAEQLAKAINVDVALAALLIQRGIGTYDQAKDFFRPSLKDLPDPFLLKDMDHAVRRLALAIAREEKILVYGDYDVDGTTSVALMYGFLKQIYTSVDYYIPDRYQEGYGISEQGIQYATEHGCSLIISLDCGIQAINLVNEARKLGIDFIIGDHHRPGENLPPAHAIINAKQAGCQYPYKELCGCGVTFKFLQAFCQETRRPMGNLYPFLNLVAVAIAADIVPITGENRILAHYGLRALNQSPQPGLKALVEVAGLHFPLTIDNVVFGIAPRINAAGRMGHAKAAVELLLASDETTATHLAAQLNQQNSQRREHDTDVTQQAIAMIQKDRRLEQAHSTVLFDSSWHKGVVGIVASRCIEQYYRPTVILTESNGKATGSARSVQGFDVYEAISDCADLLDQFGGHTHAAGLTLSVDKVPLFQKKFEASVAQKITKDQLVPCIDIDQQIDLSDITARFYGVLKQLAPFGPGNMRPVFMSEDLEVVGHPQVLKEKHLKFTVQQRGTNDRLDAIGFGMAHFCERICDRQSFSMVYSVEENHFNGHTSLQLAIRDIQTTLAHTEFAK